MRDRWCCHTNSNWSQLTNTYANPIRHKPLATRREQHGGSAWNGLDGIVRLNRTRLRKSRHTRILTSIKPTPLGKSGFAVLLKIVSSTDVTFMIKVVVN